MRHVLSGIDKCINEEANLLLTAMYTEEEILRALKEMRPIKTLRIDGFLVMFF